MTTRNLDALFQPRAIALVGASNRQSSVGAVLAANLFGAGFRGPIMTVNPHEAAIRSTLCYRSVAALPISPDLAVVATPSEAVPEIIAELGHRGCRSAIVVTAGFGEGGDAAGRGLRDRMLAAAKPHLLRILGPNCLGFISPGIGLNASFAQGTPRAGDLALISQSGAIVTGMLDWAAARNFGFSHVISLGDAWDIDAGDTLDYLALDLRTAAILLYVESVTSARKFMSAARIAARAKPVVVIKAGRSAEGAHAAFSHTGALAGADAVYDAAFRRAGMLRVHTLRDLFDSATMLSTGMRPGGGRLAVVTNGGGAGVLAVDALSACGGTLAELSSETRRALAAALPPQTACANPVDLRGDAGEERYGKAIETLLGDPQTDAVLVINCPTAVADNFKAAETLVSVHASRRTKPILTCWLGEVPTGRSRQLFSAHRIPTFDTPEEAARAFTNLVEFERNQDLLLETPPAIPDRRTRDDVAARALCSQIMATGRTVLDAVEAKRLLSFYDIPVVRTLAAATPEAAGERARELGGRVVLKILSPDIPHKSDVGGVRLDLGSAAAVTQAAREMLEAVRRRAPAARIDGFTVEPQLEREGAHELIVGVARDPTFGPVLLFGQGGTDTEIAADRAVGFPPLNAVLARAMIARTRIRKRLAGYRNVPPADMDALVAVLLGISQLVLDLPEVVELDINPLLASAAGAIAVDARVKLEERDAAGRAQLAIRPYPAELEHEIMIDGGRRLVVRAIRPEDEPRLVEMVRSCSPEDRRLRFLGALNEFPHAMAARLSQIDYDRELALVATVPGADPAPILGVVRIVATPENDRAEFAVLVRSDQKGRGLGFQLMKDIIAAARARGIKTIHSDVLCENQTMLSMASELGFTRQSEDAGVARISLAL